MFAPGSSWWNEIKPSTHHNDLLHLLSPPHVPQQQCSADLATLEWSGLWNDRQGSKIPQQLPGSPWKPAWCQPTRKWQFRQPRAKPVLKRFPKAKLIKMHFEHKGQQDYFSVCVFLFFCKPRVTFLGPGQAHIQLWLHKWVKVTQSDKKIIDNKQETEQGVLDMDDFLQ